MGGTTGSCADRLICDHAIPEPKSLTASFQVTILHSLGVEGGPKIDSKDLLSLASFCPLLLFTPDLSQYLGAMKTDRLSSVLPAEC